MTTPTTAKKNTPATAKSKDAPVNMNEAFPTESDKDPRISEVVYENAILVDFFKQYLTRADAIAAYNKDVLAEKSSDWTSGKVLAEARKFAVPENAADADPEIKSVYEAWERIATELSKARAAVVNATAKKMGITLSSTAERNSETEGPLKEQRKFAHEIGSQLEMMKKVLSNPELSTAIEEFLKDNPLPLVGRDQAHTFGTDEKSTPKYRVTVTVYDKDENVVVTADGFTKAVQGVAKLYPRGEGIKSDALRAVWEKAGNSTEKTVAPTVDFTDNDLHYVITKK
jgi:hypothetical protein